MAAALFRRGPGICVRCIHRELCRVVWRPQAALFSSKQSDRKQPRRTHIKKAKPQPALDIAKLLEQLFSQHRPGTAPPAGKARPIKASSMPTKPPNASSAKVSDSNVPPLLKTEPAVSVFPATSTFKQVDSVPKETTSTVNTAPLSPQPNPASLTNPKTSDSSETPQQSLLDFIQGSAADSASNVTVPPATTLEPSIETVIESPVDPNLSPVETSEVKAAVVEGPVELTVEAPAEEVQTKGTDSGVVVVSLTTEEERLIETETDLPEEVSHFPVETLETRAAVVEGPVEPMIHVTVDTTAEIQSTNSGVVDFSHTATVEPLLETTVEPLLEASTSPLETPERRAAAADGPVEPSIDATVDAPAQTVQTNSTDSGPVNFSHIAEEQPLMETTIDASVEASSSPLETLESRDAAGERTVEAEAAQAVKTNSTDAGVVNVSDSAREEPLIETTIEPALEANTSPVESRAAFSEATVEPTNENEATDSLSHVAFFQNMQKSAPLPLKNKEEPTIESTVEPSSGTVAVEDGVNKSEQMTLESVTLHEVEVMVESFKTDELFQTKSVLDGKAEEQQQELLVQAGTGAEYKAAAETENSSEDESEILTKSLSKWDSLSEDLQELEGASGTLVTELLCHVPAGVSKTPATVETSSSSCPAVGANGESLQMEETGTEAEAMTLESITLSDVKAEVGGLETEVLLETRNALEKEAEVVAKEEKIDVKTTIEDVAVFEDSTEAEILTLDSVSETIDAIEAETSLMLEAMFGSEQGSRQPPDVLLVDGKLGHQDEVIDREAEKESGEQEGSVLEAMTLESVTLAEVEASLGTLENKSLSETTDYLEKEAEVLAGEKRNEVEDGVEAEEVTDAPGIEYLSLPEDDALPEALQIDTLMEELLFSVPGHITGITEGRIGQEVVRANILDATVAAGSVDADTASAVTDDSPASPALKEVLPEQEVQEEGEQTETLGSENGKGTHADLDPIQRLFLEKIREYRNMHRGPSEAEPDYEKYLLEETAKLQRLYGGGDLSSFPEFTFTEPKMDQDSK